MILYFHSGRFSAHNSGTPVVYDYSYNLTCKDRLDTFDGKSLTYDPIGNPLTIGDSVLTWTQGRKLSTYKKDATSENVTYTYDENGIRKNKTVGNEVIEYITSGGEVVAQKSNSGTPTDSSDDVVITFTRGADGSLISMNRNGTIYYYVTNIQGDVKRILDSTGQVVVSYVYDAYGNIKSIDGSLKDSLGEENPFRYRSYYFDNESGYYYLQSRYYDPMMGRFISADSQINPEVNGGNVFTYASNNPVNQTDPDGHWPKWLGKAVKIAAIITVTAVVALAVVAAAPAVAGAVWTAAMVAGAYGAASSLAAATTGACALVAAGVVAIGANKSVKVATGKNYIAKAIGKKNYNSVEATVNIATVAILSIPSTYGYPNTGTGAKNLNEQLAIKEVSSNPSNGIHIEQITMRDSRMPYWMGWEKYGNTVNGIDVHFVRHRIIPIYFDFKISR